MEGNITQDIGQELKETARRIYVRGMWFYIILLIIESIIVVAGFVINVVDAISNDFEFISDYVFYNLFLPLIVFILAVVIEYLVITGIIHLITINLYAKGEIVHLLKKCSGDTAEKKISKTKKKESATEPQPADRPMSKENAVKLSECCG